MGEKKNVPNANNSLKDAAVLMTSDGTLSDFPQLFLLLASKAAFPTFPLLFIFKESKRQHLKVINNRLLNHGGYAGCRRKW